MNLLFISMPSTENQVIGWMVTVLGFVIVIISLIILFLIFKWISSLINHDWSKIIKSKSENEIEVDAGDDKNIAVAIAMALYLSREVHDEDSGEIKITRIQRRYSPWSSKIYGMNKINK